MSVENKDFKKMLQDLEDLSDFLMGKLSGLYHREEKKLRIKNKFKKFKDDITTIKNKY